MYPRSLQGLFQITLTALIFSLSLSLTHAQTNANVSISAGSTMVVIPQNAVGINTAVYDNNLMDTSVPSLIQGVGATALRYPGGSYSDVYHWQDSSGTAGSGIYINPNDTFDNFMFVANSAGATPIITVNYGSNKAGNAGGDPNEAAAWVDYANNTQHDGIKYWEIGNEVYGNGEYQNNAWEEDLHTDHSPTAYGRNVVTFVNAMKAKDPTIKVGAVLACPNYFPDGISPDWNTNLLQQCGTSIDFVVVHLYPQNSGNESDSFLLQETWQLFPGMFYELQSEINQYCGANAPNVQIFFTEANSVANNPGKQTVGLVNALYLADVNATLLEQGAGNIDWWDLHNGPDTSGNNSASLYGNATYGDYGLLSVGSSLEPAAETPFPAYYGMQMLSKLGHGGDAFVYTSNLNNLLRVHAVKQASGNLAVMMINDDPANICTANVSLSNFTPATATTYFYGETSSAITSSNSVPGGNTSFSVALPPYSLTTMVMAPPVADTAAYNFESGTQGWTTADQSLRVTTSNAQFYHGVHSLQCSLIGGATGTYTAQVSDSVQWGKKTITFHVWFPSTKIVAAIMPYVAKNGVIVARNSQATSGLKAGAWNTIVLQIPATTPFVQVGNQVGVSFAPPASTKPAGVCYVDSVD